MSYPGGKEGSGTYQKIINQLPPHDTYIEPFLGGGAIMRLKKPARHSIGIEKNHDVAGAFPIQDIHGLDLIIGDALIQLEQWIDTQHPVVFSSSTLIYADPPYLMQTRRDQRQLYWAELTDKDHEKLLDLLSEVRCMVAISGYYSSLYATYLADWRLYTFQAQTRSGKPATEHLWMNYPEPFDLHDYRYLGENFRERERIKRKKDRWYKKFSKLPILERRAMMMAIDELRQHEE